MVNKYEVINNAMTGHLDRMVDKEMEIMLKQFFSEVFEKGKEFGTVFDR